MKYYLMKKEDLLKVEAVFRQEFHKHQNEVNYKKLERVSGMKFRANTKNEMCDRLLRIQELIEEA